MVLSGEQAEQFSAAVLVTCRSRMESAKAMVSLREKPLYDIPQIIQSGAIAGRVA